MVVEFIDGPQGGIIHELPYGVDVPDVIGVNGDGGVHWYRIMDGLGKYSHTEFSLTAQRGPSSPARISAAQRAFERELTEAMAFTCPKCGRKCPKSDIEPISGECFWC